MPEQSSTKIDNFNIKDKFSLKIENRWADMFLILRTFSVIRI